MDQVLKEARVSRWGWIKKVAPVIALIFSTPTIEKDLSIFQNPFDELDLWLFRDRLNAKLQLQLQITTTEK